MNSTHVSRSGGLTTYEKDCRSAEKCYCMLWYDMVCRGVLWYVHAACGQLDGMTVSTVQI